MAELRWERRGEDLELEFGDTTLARLSSGAGIEPVNTPKPHIHPLRTPGGVVVTGFAPEDHPWHHGLQFAMPRVDAHNLWGGGTYFGPEEGYRIVEDQGRIEHTGWREVSAGEAAVAEEVTRWIGHDGEPLLDETRRWEFRLDGPTGAVVIDFSGTLASATGDDVRLETPAQRGRPDGGYGGLFLRLAEGFGAERIDGDGVDLAESGGESRTMVVHGLTGDGTAVTLGLAFLDGPTPGARRWLHRFDPFSAIGWAVAYDDGLVVPAGDAVRFEHRLVVADGHLDPSEVRRLL